MKNFNKWLALKITGAVSTMWMAYFFTFIALCSLPAVLTLAFPGLKSIFPSWMISASLIALVAWFAQTFIQLVLLSVIMVGQKIQAETTINHVKKHIDLKHNHMKKHLGIK